MANLNKTVIIQLKDCGIVDIRTDLFEDSEHISWTCPTCGPSMDYEKTLHTATVIVDSGEEKELLYYEDSEWYEDEEKEIMQISEADLMRLFLNKERLQMFTEMTLQQFLDWVRAELTRIAYSKEDKLQELWEAEWQKGQGIK